MAVQEVTRTIQVTQEIIEDQEVVFWSFEMRNGGVGSTYYMTTLEDEKGRLHAQFHRNLDSALYAARHYRLDSGSLNLPWSIFLKAAREVLDGPVNTTKRMAGRGSFHKLQGDRVAYVAACGDSYSLASSELEGLIA